MLAGKRETLALAGRNAMSVRLSLHVPEPTVRPGGRPDFGHVDVPEAGEVPRPPIDVSPSEIRDFAYTMIRVLDDKGEAVGDWAGALGSEELRRGLRDMMLHCLRGCPILRGCWWLNSHVNL